jgi:hypothetical protein
LFVVLLLFKIMDARGGGRGKKLNLKYLRKYLELYKNCINLLNLLGGVRSGSTSGKPRGRGGLGWAFSSYSSNTPITDFGSSFGKKGLPRNSYISQDDYKYSGSKGFLISSLFYGAGMQNTDRQDFYRRWNDEKDREWRETTRAPYFDNKLPGDQKIFPASAVVGKLL